MILWCAFALLTAAALICVLMPLARPGRRLRRRDADIAFYKVQLAEVDRDAARGLLEPGEVQGARTEVARRLLSASDAPTPPARAGARSTRATIAAVLAIVLVPTFSLALYLKLGRPGEPDEPLQARLAAAPADMDMAAAVARIEAHLAEHPEDGRGYEIVAFLYLHAGRADEAVAAYEKALALLGETPERRENYGEALVAAAGGTVTPQARAVFMSVLKADPSRPRSRYYVALAAEQAGDTKTAAEAYTRLVDEQPDAAWAPLLRRRLEALAAGSAPQGPAGAPAGEAAAIAALSPDDRQAAIHGMVDRLAARLAQDGHDSEGWLRLVRAYAVLNEEAKARTALADARHSLADDKAALARLDALAHELRLEGT